MMRRSITKTARIAIRPPVQIRPSTSAWSVVSQMRNAAPPSTTMLLYDINRYRSFHRGNAIAWTENRESPRSVTIDGREVCVFEGDVACRLHTLVHAYRTHGHLEADLDCLHLKKPATGKTLELKPSVYGLDDVLKGTDQDVVFDVEGIVFMGNSHNTQKYARLDEVIDHLKRTYSGGIGAQFVHVESSKELFWLARQLETSMYEKPTEEEIKRVHQQLVHAESLDHFLAKKFPTLKRYGLEGNESMLPAMDVAFRELNAAGVTDLTIGMPHRGRLNLLTELLNYPPRALFHKIKGNNEFPEEEMEENELPGDVLSHISQSTSLDFGGAQPLNVSLLPNPSHLEFVNSVAMGKARAKVDEGKNAACMLLHGDSAFCGQGVVAESFTLSNLKHFTNNGVIHLIVSNQIGFTTLPEQYRSSRYSGDVAKMVSAPIFVVNSETIEDVMRVMKLAVAYRQKFNKSVVVELVGYRKWGHNEVDEPAFTQPKMYSIIRNRPSYPETFTKELISQGVISDAEAKELKQKRIAEYEEEYSQTGTYKPEHRFFRQSWEGIALGRDITLYPSPRTGVDKDLLKQVALQSVSVPEGFHVHPRLEKYHIARRREMITNEEPLDWATAEAVAVGSLLSEGNNVRLCGQDVSRGTFSQRHFEFVDQETEDRLTPLEHIEPGRLSVVTSPLSELAVLGFEFGYSWNSPKNLNIWEAQFGDFANGAQVIIDNFISNTEDKWSMSSGMTLVLPHGMDGVGPEHSQCRIERFLQLCDGDINTKDLVQKRVNMRLVNPTTPANFFHALRRQMHQAYRKPLIVVGPKVLLRHPKAVSPLEDFIGESQFKPIISDTVAPPSKSIKHIILCSGKAFYDLEEARSSKKLDSSVAIIRLEELSPFPYAELSAELESYVQFSGAKVERVTWFQEEHENTGAYTYVASRVQNILNRLPPKALKDRSLRYSGRNASAVIAVGIKKKHEHQAKDIYEKLFANL